MSHDNENSIMSDDAGEGDITDKGDDEGSTAKGSAEGNEGNDNVWPRSSLQARSYYRNLNIWKKLIRGEG